MSKQDQPAQLKRRIARLEALLEAEKQRADKAWDAYRSALYESVEAKMQLDEIRRVLEGDK